jgi:hypothetical protein
MPLFSTMGYGYPIRVAIPAMRSSDSFTALTDALKLAAAALPAAHVPFVLGGSLAAWARGGPAPQNDLDFMLKPQDADASLQALEQIGMRSERPRRSGCSRPGMRTC